MLTRMIDLGDEIWYLVILVAIIFSYFYLRPSSVSLPKPLPPSSSSSSTTIGGAKPSAGLKTTARKKVAEVPTDAKAKIKILFGSQTGTADDFSHTLAKEAKRHGIYAEVVDLELFNLSTLRDEPVAIFVMATHGEGEPTDNAKEAYAWLANKDGLLPPDILAKFHYTVFGLGNKTYEQYNAVARFVDKKLQELGAHCIFERGEGDDDCSLEEDFNKWKKRMWGPLCKHLGLEASDSTEDEKLIYDIKNPYMARVVVNKELHTELSDRSCRHIELEIGEHLTYQPGDHLGVYPENEAALVNNLARRLNTDPSAVVALIPINQKNDDTEEAVLGPCTVGQVFTDSIDITTPPRKAVLHALADYATDTQEKQRLLLLASEAGSEEYNKFIKNDQRTVCEVLQAFPSVKPPLDNILELLPRLAPRYYSISSSANFHPGFVHITSVVVNFNTPAGRLHNGVCSSWLAKLPVHSRIPVFVRESHFRIPLSPAPLVMVGPGTGLAPFRGFLQELSHRKSQGSMQFPSESCESLATPDLKLGWRHKRTIANGWEAALFFGCRDRKHDFIYEEELLHFTREGTLSHLQLAFSREQTQKVYVQNKMLENKQLIWDFLKDRKGYLFVCGDARQMAKSVNSALHNILCECGKMTDQQATAFLEDLQKSGRYLQDVWF